MTKRAELRAVWSKRERDFMFHFDRQPADGHFLHSFMRAGQMDVTDASSGEAMAAFRAALERRESFAERAAARIAELETQLHDLTRARGDGWQLVHCDELGALRASREFACLTPDEDCECAGCMAAAESEREMT